MSAASCLIPHERFRESSAARLSEGCGDSPILRSPELGRLSRNRCPDAWRCACRPLLCRNRTRCRRRAESTLPTSTGPGSRCWFEFDRNPAQPVRRARSIPRSTAGHHAVRPGGKSSSRRRRRSTLPTPACLRDVRTGQRDGRSNRSSTSSSPRRMVVNLPPESRSCRAGLKVVMP